MEAREVPPEEEEALIESERTLQAVAKAYEARRRAREPLRVTVAELITALSALDDNAIVWLDTPSDAGPLREISVGTDKSVMLRTD